MWFLKFNIPKVGIDVDIVSIVKKSDVTTRGHVLKTVSTQELDAGGGVLAPPPSFLPLCSSPDSDRIDLYLSYLERGETG